MVTMLRYLLPLCAIAYSNARTVSELDAALRDANVIPNVSPADMEGFWYVMAKSPSHVYSQLDAQKHVYDAFAICKSVPLHPDSYAAQSLPAAEAMNTSQYAYLYMWYDEVTATCLARHAPYLGNPLYGKHVDLETGSEWTDHTLQWDTLTTGNIQCLLNYRCLSSGGRDVYQTGTTDCPGQNIYMEIPCRISANSTKPPAAVNTELATFRANIGLPEGDLPMAATTYSGNEQKECGNKLNDELITSGVCTSAPMQPSSNTIFSFLTDGGDTCMNSYVMISPDVVSLRNFSSVSIALWAWIHQDDVEGTIIDIWEVGHPNVFRINTYVDNHGVKRLGVKMEEDKTYNSPAVQVGRWQHIAVTWTAKTGTVKVYLDGAMSWSQMNFMARPITLTRTIVLIGMDFGAAAENPPRTDTIDECLIGQVAGVMGSFDSEPDSAIWSSDVIKRHYRGEDVCDLVLPLFGCPDSSHKFAMAPGGKVLQSALPIAEQVQQCGIGSVFEPKPEKDFTGMVSGQFVADIIGYGTMTWYTMAVTNKHPDLAGKVYESHAMCLGHKVGTVVVIKATYDTQARRCRATQPDTMTQQGSSLDFTHSVAENWRTHVLTTDVDSGCMITFCCFGTPGVHGVCNESQTSVTLRCKSPTLRDVSMYLDSQDYIGDGRLSTGGLCFDKNSMVFTEPSDWANAGKMECSSTARDELADSGLCRPKPEEPEGKLKFDMFGKTVKTSKASAESKAAAEGPGAAAQSGASAMTGRKRRAVSEIQAEKESKDAIRDRIHPRFRRKYDISPPSDARDVRNPVDAGEPVDINPPMEPFSA